MACIILLLVALGPEFALAYLFFTGVLSKAFDNWIWPLLGFIFFPWTTLALTWVSLNVGLGSHWDFWVWVLVIVALLFDIGRGGSTSKR